MATSTVFIHLSDLHFKGSNEEGHGVVLNALLRDVDVQLKRYAGAEVYVVFSGDLVQSGEDVSAYEELHLILAEKFESLGISKGNIVCVPGNHDICRGAVKSRLAEHEGVISQLTTETIFNNHVRNPNELTKKFAKFQAFESTFAKFGIGPNATGAGWDLNENIGIYCLNTALCSAGGLVSLAGKPISDKGRLAVDTRGLHAWLSSNDKRCKVLVMHHPLDWLCAWARDEIKAVLGKDIQLCLSGHTHEQSSYCSISPQGMQIECSAPPLYTRKSDPLGYTLILIDEKGSLANISYRQWTSRQVFVAGTAFSHTDTGEISFSGSRGSLSAPVNNSTSDTVGTRLKSRLDDALRSFSSQPIVFVRPVLSSHSEAVKERDYESKPKVSAEDLLGRAGSVVIHAPPLFGLTCLAHHLALTAWTTASSVWIYLDAKLVKPNRHSVGEAVVAELAALNVTMDRVSAILIDSLRSSDKDAQKLVRKIAESYPGMRFVCLRTNDGVDVSESFVEAAGVELENFFLWSMPRSEIRKVVADYIDAKPIGDEDLITSKLVSDIEVMNIHRTPLNCITLLKVSEVDFDDSPVNRTELIKRVLFLLFNVDEIPSYKSRPDLKDCEYVLGYFCETILRSGETRFLREKFLGSLQNWCKDQLVDLDVSIVFDVLYRNHIIVRTGSSFEFRFSYWIFYFAAQRMHHSKDFAKFIYEDMRYAQFPEVIEFYTGIDRRREDAVTALTSDLRKACDSFQEKISLPEKLDMFGLAQWAPSPDAVEQMRAEINHGVQSSKLPASVKDQYADRGYDRARPYNQDIRKILSEHSYSQMLQTMRAGARALRNSDYVDPSLKRLLLHEILRAWEQSALVLLVLVPALAENGAADFEGVRYLLDGNFGDSVQDRVGNVLVEIPQNITSYYQDDLFSQKMGPLLIHHFESSAGGLRLHFLAILLIRQRPKGWRGVVQTYIASLPKNSFYLLDVYECLRYQYKYSYASPQALEDVEYFIRMAATKHLTGAKEPGVKLINKMKGKISAGDEGVIPKRLVKDDQPA